MQKPKALLTILGKMALKPEIKFDNLFQKLYNIELWLLAYQMLAPNPGNMTVGTDGNTIDGTSLKLITDLVTDLKASRYKPKPTRRVYLPKPNGKMRPIGIVSFRDKLLQTVVKLILEAIYEPLFCDTSHGFRPNHSCHTALQAVKQMRGVRWWVEGDISGFFDNLNQSTLLNILAKRITDQRFLHLISQFLKAGYMENWQYHQTYSGTVQGGPLSPILSNIYLNELDKAIANKLAEFNLGKSRQLTQEYIQVRDRLYRAKKKARQNGDWSTYKALKRKLRTLPTTDPQDPNFRRLTYVRYCDDWLMGVIGSHRDALNLKEWIGNYLKNTLQLELSVEKTLVTNTKKRVRFLGYDLKRWNGTRHLTYKTRHGVKTQRTTNYQLTLLLPPDKLAKFGQEYGNTTNWQGKHRPRLLNLSELEILLTYNAEVRGFLNYYALATNLKKEGSKLLWLTTNSFFKTIANKRKSTFSRVAKNLKRGVCRYVISLTKPDGTLKEYELVASTRQLHQTKISQAGIDLKANTVKYSGRNELTKRLLAQTCEWCGTQEGVLEVHHIRKLKDLKGRSKWEQLMIARKRKTQVLCQSCHVELHAGRLLESKRAKGKLES
ncbi:MAG: hypothetical protein HXX20_21450 [Chloroflexi bacterium]|nr:hypothetical protein [Chloroflexota bacterium]